MAPARNKYPERATGFEAQVCCEIGHVVAQTGIRLKDIGEIVKQLLKNYEKHISNAPLGKTFEECYDIDNKMPKPEYLKLHQEAMERWVKIGFSEYHKRRKGS